MESNQGWSILGVAFIIFISALLICGIILIAYSVFNHIRDQQLRWHNPEEYAKRAVLDAMANQQQGDRSNDRR